MHSSSDEPSRFVVGIDLGTTNCAVAYVDTRNGGTKVRDFPVVQTIAPGETAARDTLPSFLYLPAAGEAESDVLVGEYARDHGATSPQRMVASAKSWLCHPGVDRTAPLLPWQAAADVERMSPIAATSHLLAHLKEAWNRDHPQHPLQEQSIVLTVPASFDETARELTILAARDAGLERLTLLEEPQAAFYAWMDRQDKGWDQVLTPGQRILICDVGGGTTDFALIEVRESGEGGVGLRRIAVGDHLMLGGDNLDLALAHAVEAKLGESEPQSEPLAPSRWYALVRLCRGAKERLLGHEAPESLSLSLPGSGSRLIGGSTSVRVSRDEVFRVLVDGFMPQVGPDDRPSDVGSGFQEFGLPYTADPAMTRHLAAFLQDQGGTLPDAILLNGGLFESPGLRSRWLEVVQAWAGAECTVLDHPRLDLAVARGAARYGLVRRGEGTRIAGGLARAYYVGVESQDRNAIPGTSAMCLAPSGLEEGSEVELAPVFDLRIRQPVEFPIFMSSTRTTDEPGALIDVEPEQVTALPPIRTVLKAGRKAKADTVQVRLLARLTELGTLETWFREVGGSRSWRLQFDVRGMTAHDADGEDGRDLAAGVVEEKIVVEARAALKERLQAREGKQAAGSGVVLKTLEARIGDARTEWPPALLRGLWETLEACGETRKAGPTQEARWLNLVGFTLRPGYGVPLDDWRVAETWKAFHGQLHFAGNEMCRAEWWILWRRVAGGLSRGQQDALAGPLVRGVKAGKSSRALRDVFRGGSHETAEVWRLLGSLERLPVATRVELGELALAAMRKQGLGVWNRAGVWALGRLGGRVPQYGPLQEVVPVETVEGWLKDLLKLAAGDRSAALALMLMARRTGDRYRDISAAVRDAVVDTLGAMGAPGHYRELVEKGGAMDREEQASAFGEALPSGIRLRG